MWQLVSGVSHLGERWNRGGTTESGHQEHIVEAGYKQRWWVYVLMVLGQTCQEVEWRHWNSSANLNEWCRDQGHGVMMSSCSRWKAEGRPRWIILFFNSGNGSLEFRILEHFYMGHNLRSTLRNMDSLSGVEEEPMGIGTRISDKYLWAK